MSNQEITPIHLLPALRQYRHNDSPEFLAGYDYAEVNKVYEALQARITELEGRIAKAILLAKFPPVDKAILYELGKGE